MRAQSPRRVPTGDSRSRACRPTRTTMPSMEEVLTRRIQRYLDGDEKFSPLPDVMLIDGGITHAGVAERVCAQMHARADLRHGQGRPPPHARARHRTGPRDRPARRAERLRPDRSDPEETHRFAITFHHESHSRSSTRSALDGIPGVGKVRAQALLKTFKSVKAIREADIFALERVLPKRRRRVRLPSFSRGNGRKKRMKCNFLCDRPFDGKSEKKRDFCDLCQQKSKNQVDINEFQ